MEAIPVGCLLLQDHLPPAVVPDVRVVDFYRHVFAMSVRGLLSSPARRRLAASFTGAVLLGLLPTVQSPSPAHIQTSLTAGGSWLNRLNLWRSQSGLSSLTENTVWSDGDLKHSIYMVKTGQATHGENSALAYYTPEGNAASLNGNIEVTSSTARTDDQSIDWWMAAPFHAMGMLDPRLQTTGFGSYRDSTTSPWQSGFSLDTIRGNSFTGGSYPVYFPGNGSTQPMSVYAGNEFPDPLQACPGYSAPTGLPVFVEVGGNVATTAGPVHSFTGNGVALAHCVIDSTNAALSSYLTSRGGVIVIPQQPLQSGVTYTVALTVNGLPYTWSFTVNPFINTVVPPPAGWSSLGGTLTSGPAVSASGATQTDAFARGTDNALWHRSWNGTTWGAWDSLGGAITADPSAVSQGPNQIDVFVRGTDNAIWHRNWNGTTWTAWDRVGGVATSAPAATSWGAGRLDLVVRGTDNGLWHRAWTTAGWGAWDAIGGTATSDPGVAAWGASRLDIFVRGTDNALWHRSGDGTGAWSAWDSLGGTANLGPNATSCVSGHLDVFVRGAGNAVWQLGYNGTSWTGWKSVGGTWASHPAAACRPGTTIIDVATRGTDDALWTGTVVGT